MFPNSMTKIDDTIAFELRPPFEMRSFGLSDQGQKRESNEDCFAVAELARTIRIHQSNLSQSTSSISPHRAFVFLIADGVGGSKAGEVASGLSVATIEDFLLNTLKHFSNLQAGEEQGALRALQDALCQADSRIFEEVATHPEWQGMATTLTMAFAVNWRLFVAHAGDSRRHPVVASRYAARPTGHAFPTFRRDQTSRQASARMPEFPARRPHESHLFEQRMTTKRNHERAAGSVHRLNRGATTAAKPNGSPRIDG
jgi:hypothetical protein